MAVLERGLEDADGFVRAESVRALAALGADAATRPLDDPEPGVRLAAAEAVAKSGAADAVDRLVGFAYADDGQHRREAARLLRDLDRTAATARFVAALEDRDRLRLAPIAIEALEELNRPVPATV
jgi:HEAT repeat protein